MWWFHTSHKHTYFLLDTISTTSCWPPFLCQVTCFSAVLLIQGLHPWAPFTKVLCVPGPAPPLNLPRHFTVLEVSSVEDVRFESTHLWGPLHIPTPKSSVSRLSCRLTRQRLQSRPHTVAAVKQHNGPTFAPSELVGGWLLLQSASKRHNITSKRRLSTVSVINIQQE